MVEAAQDINNISSFKVWKLTGSQLASSMLLGFSVDRMKADRLTKIVFQSWSGSAAEAISPDILTRLGEKAARLRSLSIRNMSGASLQGRKQLSAMVSHLI